MHAVPTNAEIARLRELGRRRRSRSEAGRFLVEGPKLVAEVLHSQLVVVDVIADDDWLLDPALLDVADHNGVDVRRAGARAIERISTTSSPQPVVAEVELPVTDWTAVGHSNPRGASRDPVAVLVGVDLNDPGNVGTIARSAVAAGFEAVIALGDCADPFGPKAVRASAGALFHVPVVVDRSVEHGMEQLAAMGCTRIGTRMLDATPCDQADFTTSLALVLGSEAHGLTAADSSIDTWVSVPMPGRVESLNVAMAATVLSYEVARQRRVGQQ